MNRIMLPLLALLLVPFAATGEDRKAPAPPATPQESAGCYFAAMIAGKNPNPPPMAVKRWHMNPEQTGDHARMVVVQLMDRKTPVKPDQVVVGKTIARVICKEVEYTIGGSKMVVYIDLEKEGEGWFVADVNFLDVSADLKSLIDGFKETKDPKAIISQPK